MFLYKLLFSSKDFVFNFSLLNIDEEGVRWAEKLCYLSFESFHFQNRQNVAIVCFDYLADWQ